MSPTRTEFKSGVIGSILAGAFLGALLHIAIGGEYMSAQAGLYIDTSGTAIGWSAHLFHSAIFGVIYVGVVTGYIDPYVDVVLSLTQRSEMVSNAFMPLIHRFGMATVVTSAMGMIYGILVWVVFASFILPTFVTEPKLPVPHINGVILFVYVIYGLILGILYGIQITR